MSAGAKENTSALLFDLNGKPSLGQSFPLALQHVVAMIVGCVTPAIIVAGVGGLSNKDSVILIQAALVLSALTTLVQLYPLKKGKLRIGSGLPVIMGISFAYVPTMQAIAGDFGVGTILGAPDCRRYHRGFRGNFYQTDPQILSTADYRHRGIFHRPFLVPHSYQLHGRRCGKPAVRILAELDRSIHHPDYCDGTEPLRKRDMEIVFHINRNYRRIYSISVLRHG